MKLQINSMKKKNTIEKHYKIYLSVKGISGSAIPDIPLLEECQIKFKLSQIFYHTF